MINSFFFTKMFKVVLKYISLIISKPGIALQNITTKIPNDKQVEVALEALKCAFNYNTKKYEGEQHIAEVIG